MARPPPDGYPPAESALAGSYAIRGQEKPPLRPSVDEILKRIDQALHAATTLGETFRPETILVERKKGGSPVTAADHALDALLNKELMREGEGWLSEESVDDPVRLACPLTWIVDPIDGTRDFTEGSPEWSVSVGCAWNGEILAGGVAQPAKGIIMLGAPGAGVWKNGERVPRRTHIPVEGARVLASRSEIRRGEWEDFADDPFQVIPLSSIALKLAQVGVGDAEASWALGPKNEWDIAGGAAIAIAAGYNVYFADGKPLKFNNANPLIRGVIALPDPATSPEWASVAKRLEGRAHD